MLRKLGQEGRHVDRPEIQRDILLQNHRKGGERGTEEEGREEMGKENGGEKKGRKKEGEDG